MQVTIRGIGFDVDPQTDLFDPNIGNTPFARSASHKAIYGWTCPNGPGRFLQRLTADGHLNLPNIVAFHEWDGNPPFARLDKKATQLMKIKVLGALRRTKITEVAGDVARKFGKHKIKIDVSTFDWLKPVASYVVWADVNFHYFALSNARRKLTFYLGLPHSVKLTADIAGICDAKNLIALLQQDKKTEAELGVTTGGNANSRTVRRAHLRERIRFIRSMIGMGSVIGPELRAELERISAELEELEDE